MPTTILDNESYPEALQRRYAEEAKAEKQAEIIRMAREAGFSQPWTAPKQTQERLVQFAALVAAHEREKHNSPSWETVDDAIAAEREACAKLFADEDCLFEGKHIATAIRARS